MPAHTSLSRKTAFQSLSCMWSTQRGPTGAFCKKERRGLCVTSVLVAVLVSIYTHSIFFVLWEFNESRHLGSCCAQGKSFWFFLLFFFLLCCQIVPPHKLGRTAIKAEEKKGKQKKPAGNCHCCWQEGGKGTGKDANRKFKRLFP